MGHSERGSYVVPIYVPVGTPDENEGQYDLLVEGEEVKSATAVESDERRMTRTFAEAMQALNNVVLQPERLPTTAEINDLVTQGVTREGSTDVVVGHFRPGSGGQRPPRVSSAMAISASGLWNP